MKNFGYLTYYEKANLENELIEKGFDLNDIIIKFPESQKSYGELLEFIIKYKLDLKFKTSLVNNASKENKIDIVVKKYSYSKIE